MVMLEIDFPTSVKPTKSRAPTEPLVPTSGMLIDSDVPSEKVTVSAKKTADWIPLK